MPQRNIAAPSDAAVADRQQAMRKTVTAAIRAVTAGPAAHTVLSTQPRT
jgi:hypothetical protein